MKTVYYNKSCTARWVATEPIEKYHCEVCGDGGGCSYEATDLAGLAYLTGELGVTLKEIVEVASLNEEEVEKLKSILAKRRSYDNE